MYTFNRLTKSIEGIFITRGDCLMNKAFNQLRNKLVDYIFLAALIMFLPITISMTYRSFTNGFTVNNLFSSFIIILLACIYFFRKKLSLKV